MMHIDRKKILNIFIVFFFTFLTISVYAGKSLTSNVYPSGDTAADMLLANKIHKDGILLTGHYSRFEFNHPGPFFFYYNTLFEWLFKKVGICRNAIWVWATIFLNSVLLSFSALVLNSLIEGKTKLPITFIFLILFITTLRDLLASIWIPYRLIIPYIAFIVCSIAVSRSRLSMFPFLCLFSGILIHGYVIMPIFTLPIAFMSLYLGWRNQKKQKDSLRMIAVGCTIWFLFASPILIDFAFNFPGNLGAIRKASVSIRSNFNSPSAVFDFMSVILFYHANIWHLGIILFGILFGLRDNLQKGSIIAVYCFIFGTSSILFFSYFTTAPQPLYFFMGAFYSGFWCLSISIILLSVKDLSWSSLPVERSTKFLWLSFFFVAVISMISYLSIGPKPYENKEIGDLVDFIESNISPDTENVKIDYTTHDEWVQVAGVLLEASRRHIPICATWQHMRSVYTDRYICDDKTADFKIVPLSQCESNICIGQTDQLGIINLRSK